MISKEEIAKVNEALASRSYWRYFDANTHLRNDLYISFVKSKTKPDELKRIWAVNMSQKWGCDAEILYKKCPDRCPIFNTPLDYGLGKNTIVRNVSGENNDWFRPSVDHIVARSRGGDSSDVANMVVISLRANTLKNNIETLEELNTLHEGIKKLYFTKI
jgi:hypothetical protein